MSTTLDLRGLTDAQLGAQLNEAVARVHGWKDFRDQTVGPGVSRLGRWGINPETGRPGTVPPYATSADAVLPLLEKYEDFNCMKFTAVIRGVKSSPVHRVEIPMGGYTSVEGAADSIALAACIALLRANGYEVLT